MKTSIIILNFNDFDNTYTLIEQIRNYNCLDVILIVDNQSTDGSYEKLKKLESKKIKILQAKSNRGYGAGNNIGLKYLEANTDSKYVIISNPDINIEESVIVELLADMENENTISFLGPKILERGTISRGWKLPTFLSEFLSTLNFFGRYANKLLKYRDDYYDKKLVKVDVIHGCFFLARLKDFQNIHFFDENTFLYYEENIIGSKAKENNMSIYVDTSVSVIHNLSQSVDKSIKKVKKYKILKQSMFYYEKEYRHLNFIAYILLKLTYFISLVISYLTFWI